MQEVKTPFNGVVAAPRLLQTEFDTGNTAYSKDLLRMISSAAENVDQIFARVRQLLRYENMPYFQLQEEEFEFMKWLKDLLQSMMGLFLEKGISIAKQVSKDFPALIVADKTYLTQILYNILMNALKFSPEATIVEINCFGTENKLCIAISDQGIGIPQSEIPFIFKEFHQINADITAKFGGMGIGLSIVKQLLEIMGAGINVTSEPGAGSTFCVVLPIK